MRLLAIALLLVSAAAFASCGGSNDIPSDPEDIEAEIREQYEELVEAFTDGDVDDVYDFIAQECRDEVERSDIAGAILMIEAFLGADWELRIDEFELLEHEGNTAKVRVVSTMISDGEEEESSEETLELVREDGRWRDTDCSSFDTDGDVDVDVSSDDEEPGASDDSTPEEEEALQAVDLNEVFGVEAEALGTFSEVDLSGTIGVKVTKVEIMDAIEPPYGDVQEPRGKFIVVYYDLTSDLNANITPGWQINDNLRVTDKRGRRWELADYQGEFTALSSAVAKAAGCDDPGTELGAGFATCTAAVFDVPSDATGLSLEWKEAGVVVDLGL